MPILTVNGLVGVSGSEEDRLINDLMYVTASTLDLTENQVWVYIDDHLRQRCPGKNVFVRVEELFMKADRDTSVRERLVEKISQVFVTFVRDNPQNSIDNVVVFINELDRSRGGYIYVNLRDK
jgi:phenylpyruvate tautomerase PptA (4-oxalocrotonate tautomerase family)